MFKFKVYPPKSIKIKYDRHTHNSDPFLIKAIIHEFYTLQSFAIVYRDHMIQHYISFQLILCQVH